jgi:hypothetical protein
MMPEETPQVTKTESPPQVQYSVSHPNPVKGVKEYVEDVFTALNKLDDFLGVNADDPAWVMQVQALTHVRTTLNKIFPYTE